MAGFDSGGGGAIFGEQHRPDKCNHAPDDGCEWCCRTCNYDRHFCPGCGTVSDHFETPCDECYVLYHLARPHLVSFSGDNYQWRCGCGAHGNTWSPNPKAATDQHRRHRKRMGE